jgi:hypothetical protein
MPYLFATYNFQDDPRAAASHETMARLEADGWTVSAASPAFTEMSCLWYKPAVQAPEEDDGTVHVDWAMLPDERRQLFDVLRQHADVPYIAALIAGGAIPAEEPVSAE